MMTVVKTTVNALLSMALIHLGLSTAVRYILIYFIATQLLVLKWYQHNVQRYKYCGT